MPNLLKSKRVLSFWCFFFLLFNSIHHSKVYAEQDLVCQAELSQDVLLPADLYHYLRDLVKMRYQLAQDPKNTELQKLYQRYFTEVKSAFIEKNYTEKDFEKWLIYFYQKEDNDLGRLELERKLDQLERSKKAIADVFKKRHPSIALAIAKKLEKDLVEVSWRDLLKVEKLEISGRDIIELKASDFEGLDNLRWLQIKKTSLKTLPEDLLTFTPALTYFSVTESHLESLPEKLFWSSNQIVGVNFSDNFIEHLPSLFFTGLSTLTKIDFHNNKIRVIPETLFSDLENLIELYLFNNKIETLEKNTFKNLKKLLILNLGTNEIKFLPEELFLDTINLDQLSLIKNRFIEIPLRLFRPLKKIKWLHISDNPIESMSLNHFKGLPKDVHMVVYNSKINLFRRMYINGILLLLGKSGIYVGKYKYERR